MAKSLRVRKAVINGRSVFAPADPLADELMGELPLDTEFTATLTSTRGIGRNPRGKYWAGLAVLVDNFNGRDRSMWPTSKSIHRELLVSAGFGRKRYSLDGKSFTEEADVELWDSLTNSEIDTFLEQVRTFVAKRWGFDPWAQWEEKKAAEKAATKQLMDWTKGPPPTTRS